MAGGAGVCVCGGGGGCACQFWEGGNEVWGLGGRSVGIGLRAVNACVSVGGGDCVCVCRGECVCSLLESRD